MKNNTLNKLTPQRTFHPGEDLKDELEARDMSQAELAKLLGMKKSQLNEIIRGKRNMSADIALLLEEVLGISAEFWVNAQKQYELDKARINEKTKKQKDAIEKWNQYKDKIAVKFLKRQGYISGDPLYDIPEILSIYGIKTLENLNDLFTKKQFARLRKSEKLDVNPVNLIGWVKLLEYRAKHEKIVKFNPDRKEELIGKLKEIINRNKDTQEKVKELLAEYGIKLVYQKKGEKTPIDGISFWSDHNPAIGLTVRHKRIDNFAFTLFHELGHIYEHLTKNKEAEFIDLKDKNHSTQNKKEEKEADIFAKNHLIDSTSWKEFYENYHNITDELILEFAKKEKIHPAIVLGRLCYETGNYRRKTKIDHNIN